MSLSHKALITGIVITAGVAGFLFSSYLQTGSENNTPGIQIQGTVLPTPRKILVPELVKSDGSSFSNKDIQGKWSLVFFGYMHCPDICPSTLGVLSQAKSNYGDEFPQVYLVTVDPERDKAAALDDYVKYFDPDFIGITGEPEFIQALTLQMSVIYMKVPGADEDNYDMDHSSSILMINPDGKLTAFLSPPHTVTGLIESVNKIIN